MKLSEAILLSIGAVDNEPRLFLSTNRDKPCGCAIGTALYSLGETEYTVTSSWIVALQRHWPWLSYELGVEVSTRHSSGESRESIAQWIASIEPQEIEDQDSLRGQNEGHAMVTK